jgi:hypothetical protein
MSEPQPPASRVYTWLGRLGVAVVGILAFLAYVFLGLLNGFDVYTLVAIPIGLASLVGFLLLVLSLSEKVPGVVVALVYVVAVAALGSALWLITGHAGVVTFTVVLDVTLGLVFLIAGLAGRGGEAKGAKSSSQRKR